GVSETDAVGLADGVGDAELAALLGVAEAEGTTAGWPRVASHSPSPMSPISTRIARPMTHGAHQVRGSWSGTHCWSCGAAWRGPPTGTPARADHRAGCSAGSLAGGMTAVSSLGGRGKRSVS